MRIILIAVILSLTGCVGYHKNGNVKYEPSSSAMRKALVVSSKECFSATARKKQPKQLDISKLTESAQIAWAAGMAVTRAVEAMNPQNPTDPCAQAQVAYEQTKQVQSTNRSSFWKKALMAFGIYKSVDKIGDVLTGAIAGAGTKVVIGGASSSGGSKGGNGVLGGGDGNPTSSSTSSSDGAITGVTVNTGDHSTVTNGLPVNAMDITGTSFTSVDSTSSAYEASCWDVGGTVNDFGVCSNGDGTNPLTQ